jgi:hypothetical protein
VRVSLTTCPHSLHVIYALQPTAGRRTEGLKDEL